MSGPITLAVVNARLWTGDQAAPWAEALAVSGERLIAVGTNADIRRLASTVTPIEADGSCCQASSTLMSISSKADSAWLPCSFAMPGAATSS
jgi:hypothetical protein